MMESLDDFVQLKLAERERKDLRRKLTIPSADLVDFTSNDYLGLARSAELFNFIRRELEAYPVTTNGATGSRLLSGNSALTESVEKNLAAIFNGETALLFNSGYHANLSVLSCFPAKGDTVLYDELAHASIKDGARLSLANRFSFRHNDLNDLERKIKKSTGRIFIAVESVYSMDGDECPLIELTRLAEENGCVIVLDEAHTTGVMGHHGSGFASSLGLEKQIPIRIYTFGKALGTHGACVICSDRCRQYLINFARPFIYTTALPPHNVLSIDCAFRFLRQKPELLMALEKNIKKYTSLVHDLVERTESRSAIQTIIRPGNQSAKRLSAVLRSAGFDVRAILSPTVPEGKERLRISIHSYNTESEIEQLTEIVKRHVL